MTQPPQLLNEDGNASIATCLMMSHHGLRRDLSRFASALPTVARDNVAKLSALREEWDRFRATLHGHHEAEDSGVFPGIESQQPGVHDTISRLSRDHRLIDALLERGDRAFLELPDTEPALAVIHELQALLEPHLALEEAELIPFLRPATAFPAPPDEETATMYAAGFAWSMQGVAPEVIARVCALLPEDLLAKLPAARAAFDARCEHVWGSLEAGGGTWTPIPERG